MIRDFTELLDYIYQGIRKLTVISIGTLLMRENSNEHPSRPKRRNRSSSPLPYFLLFCGAVAAVFFYFKYQENGFLHFGHPEPPGQNQPVTENTSTSSVTQKDTAYLSDNDSTDSSTLDILVTSESALPSVDSPDENDAPEQDGLNVTTDDHSIQNVPVLGTSLSTIHTFYTHLDQQKYIESFQIPTPSEVYFSTLIQKILNTPPIVSGETSDLFNILKNTAHFFRIVGKNNIQVMKAILDQEKDSFERVLAEYYRLTEYPDQLKSNFSIEVSEESLYDYAGFFLTTMGGRLYLFRRDSVSRMVISYYSILIVDKANRESRNSHGIDIRPAVETLIQELENSGAQLQMKSTYLDTLYGLKEKYM